jgi:predicted amidohydrolase
MASPFAVRCPRVKADNLARAERWQSRSPAPPRRRWRRSRGRGAWSSSSTSPRPTRQTGVLYDTTFVLDAEGELVGRYRKMHLYPTEHGYFRAGDALPVFDRGFVRLGTATCFDHAFPEIFSTLAVRGAQLIVSPSAVPVGYKYLLDLRTRAGARYPALGRRRQPRGHRR